MREYLGIAGAHLVHVFERTLYAYANGSDIGLCDDAQRLMYTRAGDRPMIDFVPTCLLCIAKEARVRARP